MINKEAIEELRSNKSKSGWGFMCGECPCKCDESCELNQALELAIKALELADCPQLQAECKACGGAFCDGEEETT